MRKSIFLGGILVSLFFLQSCIYVGPSVRGSGTVTRENRQLSGFVNLEVSNGLEVLLVSDSTEYLIVVADDNLHDYIRTELKGKTLEIYSESRIRSAESKKVYVHYVGLEEVESTSGSVIRSEGLVRGSKVAVKASSGSMQFIEIQTDEVKARCSSGAQIYLSGASTKAEVQASSGAQFIGSELRTKRCELDVSSGAQISIEVADEIIAEASSGGQIRYSGKPAKTEIHTSSGGSVSPK
ncbi:head GIN domain-containing protein [Mangrovibacterium sp.]|uniref:head GIN domain-containing protein n=1 Tax=Mangrovibacterium sp. TaxID=1961364 RepID=UPI003561A72E